MDIVNRFTRIPELILSLVGASLDSEYIRNRMTSLSQQAFNHHCSLDGDIRSRGELSR